MISHDDCRLNLFIEIEKTDHFLMNRFSHARQRLDFLAMLLAENESKMVGVKFSPFDITRIGISMSDGDERETE